MENGSHAGTLDLLIINRFDSFSQWVSEKILLLLWGHLHFRPLSTIIVGYMCVCIGCVVKVCRVDLTVTFSNQKIAIPRTEERGLSIGIITVEDR